MIAGPMEIILVRHGEPEWVRDGLNVVDPPLTERGHRQAERVATALEGEEFDEIVISPLARPRLTAAPTLARRGADEVIEAFLQEIREPNWHGTPPSSPEGLRGGALACCLAAMGRCCRRRGVRDFVERVRAGATDSSRPAVCTAASRPCPCGTSMTPSGGCRVRPRRHEWSAALSSARSRSGAVGVDSIRHGTLPSPGWHRSNSATAHLQPDQVVRRRAPRRRGQNRLDHRITSRCSASA